MSLSLHTIDAPCEIQSVSNHPSNSDIKLELSADSSLFIYVKALKRGDSIISKDFLEDTTMDTYFQEIANSSNGRSSTEKKMMPNDDLKIQMRSLCYTQNNASRSFCRSRKEQDSQFNSSVTSSLASSERNSFFLPMDTATQLNDTLPVRKRTTNVRSPPSRRRSFFESFNKPDLADTRNHQLSRSQTNDEGLKNQEVVVSPSFMKRLSMTPSRMSFFGKVFEKEEEVESIMTSSKEETLSPTVMENKTKISQHVDPKEGKEPRVAKKGFKEKCMSLLSKKK